MKKLTTYAALGALSIALAACGTAEDASAPPNPDTVEMAADEALEPIVEEPVADADATEDLEAIEGPAAVSEETAAAAADNAANVAEEAAAAAAEAEAAVDAAGDAVDALEDIGN
ncbi:MAG: hypothetical protein AAF553_00715 [Pseudomonadota bacterium]